MTAFSIDATDKEPTIGWADIQPTRVHTDNILQALSLSAWKLASKMVDDGYSWDDIERMQETAIELEKFVQDDQECNCVTPEQSCAVCRAIARVIYDKEYKMEK